MSIVSLGGFVYVDRVLVSPLSPRPVHPLSPASTFLVETSGHRHNVPMLKECIAKVPRLLGCEAAYYFPKGLDFCHVPGEGEGGGNESAGGELDEEEAGAVGRSRKQDGTRKGAGNLAIHIRSGDIFDNDVLSGYGQVQMCNNLLNYRFCVVETSIKRRIVNNPSISEVSGVGTQLRCLTVEENTRLERHFAAQVINFLG